MAAAVTTSTKPCTHATPDRPVCAICSSNRRAVLRYRARVAADPARRARALAVRRARWRRITGTEKHREQRRRWNRATYARHRDKIVRYRGQWVRRHGEHACAWTAARRARKRGMGAAILRWEVLREKAGGRCYLCATTLDPRERAVRRLRETVDHILPLGVGRHEYENCALVHYSCNAVKRRRVDVRLDHVPADLRARCQALIALARMAVAS